MSRTHRRIAALVLATLCTGALITPSSCSVLRYAQASRAAEHARSFRGEIRESLEQAPQPEWAGRYAHGDGFVSRELVVSAAGFAYLHTHCTGRDLGRRSFTPHRSTLNWSP